MPEAGTRKAVSVGRREWLGTGKLGVERLFCHQKAGMSHLTSHFTTVSSTEQVLSLNWMLSWVVKYEASRKVGRVRIKIGLGEGIAIFTTDYPGRSTLMNVVNIQINTSLKHSFRLLPCEEVYLSGWGAAVKDRASH